MMALVSEPEQPIVTVLLPARNEERDIATALEAIATQDYPHDCLEVLVVDAASTDATAQIASEELAGSGYHDARVISNATGSTPSSLNRGLAEASGDYLCRVDARSVIPRDYVRRCVEILSRRVEVAVVGGTQLAIPRSSESRSIGIARALNNRFATGLARYRRGSTSGPTDTVYLGAFRTNQVRAVGGWDERWLTNQDFELNRRMRRLGGVWFEQDLDVGYRPRARLGELFSQYRRFGAWKARYWSETGDRPQPRQLVLLGVPLLAVGSALWAIKGGWRRTGMVGAAGLLGALGVELIGPSGPRGGPRAHAESLLATSVIAAGWLTGVAAELVRRQ